MLKITISIKENTDNESCKVKLITPKDLTKCTEPEKRCGAMVMNEVEKAILNLQNK